MALARIYSMSTGMYNLNPPMWTARSGGRLARGSTVWSPRDFREGCLSERIHMQWQRKAVSTLAWLCVGMSAMPANLGAWAKTAPADPSSRGKGASVAGTGTGTGTAGVAGSFLFGTLDIVSNPPGFAMENEGAFIVGTVMQGSSWAVTVPPPQGQLGNFWNTSPPHPTNPGMYVADHYVQVMSGGVERLFWGGHTVTP